MLLHSVPFSFSLREMCSNIWESPPVQREAGITGDTRGRQRGASASCIEKASTVSALTENGFTLQVDGNTIMECDSFLERFIALIGAEKCLCFSNRVQAILEKYWKTEKSYTFEH